VDKWAEAMSAATGALQDFRDAETKRQARNISQANSIVKDAMASLKCRYGIPTVSHIVSDHLSSQCSVDAIPILDRPMLIMSSWDDEEIERI
jgi:hypothetical protein